MTEKTMTPPGYSGALLAMLADSPQRRANAVADVAKLMRQRANAATGEKRTTWMVGETKGTKSEVVVDDHEQPTVLVEVFAEHLEAVNEHIAAIGSPSVALELADWLEDCAIRYQRGDVVSVSDHAVALCRAYLAADVEEGA